MSSIASFLESLNDYELAFLYAYKYNTYPEASQKQLKDALLARGMDISGIQHYIKEYTFNPTNDGCPRCNSQKYLENGMQCTICDYVITAEDERQKPTVVKIAENIMNIIGKGY